jgi:O-acetylserine/cysteine efflux transporter
MPEAPTSTQFPTELEPPPRATWLLGAERLQRLRTSQALLALGLVALCVVWGVVAGRRAGTPLGWLVGWALTALSGQLACVALVRSGRTALWSDPALTQPQIVLTLVLAHAVYPLVGELRAGIQPIIITILMFAAFDLRPAQTARLSVLALGLLATAMYVGVEVWPRQAVWRDELSMLLLMSFVIPGVWILATRLAHIRARLLDQRQELRDALKRIEALAVRDALTGLYNRRQAERLLERALRRHRRSGTAFAIALVDLDHFKGVNDRYGHEAGDTVLRHFAQVAQAQLRETDTLTRWGGEEFLLLIDDADPEAARGTAERLRRTVQQSPAPMLHGSLGHHGVDRRGHRGPRRARCRAAAARRRGALPCQGQRPQPGRAGAAGTKRMSQGLPLPHALLALAVVAIWGSNFVVMKLALAHFTPLWLACLRFTLAALPLLWLARPRAPLRWVAAYGLLIGCGQFGLLFVALRADISPGLASLVVQSQVCFTLLLAWAWRGQALRGLQWLALLLAFGGFGWIGWRLEGGSTQLGLLMCLGAGLSWALANLVSVRLGPVNMLAFMVWSSAFAAPVLALLALTIEGGAALWTGALSAGWTGWSAVLWQAVGNTLFGYGVWGWLLARHPASQVVPLALLVPLFGMGSAAGFLGEALQDWKLQGAALVMGGLALNAWALRRPLVRRTE